MERASGTEWARETVRTGQRLDVYQQLSVRDPASLEAAELVQAAGFRDVPRLAAYP